MRWIDAPFEETVCCVIGYILPVCPSRVIDARTVVSMAGYAFQSDIPPPPCMARPTPGRMYCGSGSRGCAVSGELLASDGPECLCHVMSCPHFIAGQSM